MWKRLMLEARELMGQAGGVAYDRVVLLIQVFDDQDFKVDAGDDHKASHRLDELLGDLCLDFLEARQLLRHYPDRDTWASGRLRKMYDDMIREMFAARSKTASSRDRDRDRKQQARADAASPPTALLSSVSPDPVATLKARVGELEKENAVLRATIARLKKVLDAELVSV